MNQSDIKILMITSRADFGGGPEHLFRLVERLSREIDIYIACPKDFPYWERYTKLVGENRLIEIPHRKFTAGALLMLIELISSKKINLVHSHGKGAGVYSRIISILTSARCVHTLHGLHVQNYSGIKRELYLLMERFLAAFTDRIITVSEGEYNLILEYKLAAQNKLRVIENSVAIPDERVSEIIFKDEKLNVIILSRFDYSKNTALIIPIAEELRRLEKINNFEFVILGTGPDKLEFEKEAEEKKLTGSISLKGFIENPREHLIKSFCYISTSRWEGMPLGVLEAMSVGLPVIASNVVGNKDVVRHGSTGFLYDATKPAEAAEYLIKLAGDRELWKKFSNASRLNAEERFSVERMADETKKVYLEIFNKGSEEKNN